MQLDKTVIIPTDNSDLAVRLFGNLIYEEDCILAVVLGDTDEAKSAVVKADRRAGIVVAGFGRKVAWVRSPAVVRSVLDRLQPGFDAGGVVAFSVSLSNKVADVIRVGDIIDYLRIEQLYMKAGFTA